MTNHGHNLESSAEVFISPTAMTKDPILDLPRNIKKNIAKMISLIIRKEGILRQQNVREIGNAIILKYPMASNSLNILIYVRRLFIINLLKQYAIPIHYSKKSSLEDLIMDLRHYIDVLPEKEREARKRELEICSFALDDAEIILGWHRLTPQKAIKTHNFEMEKKERFRKPRYKS